MEDFSRSIQSSDKYNNKQSIAIFGLYIFICIQWQTKHQIYTLYLQRFCCLVDKETFQLSKQTPWR